MNERILVVEDTEAILDAVTDALNAEGFEVQGASDGKVALETALAEPFDLVDGYMIPNERPGLGITLNRDFVRAISVPS